MPRKICRCAASLFKVLYIDTNFLPKLRKCCREVMVVNWYRSRVALQVTPREVINFLVIDTISGYVTPFPVIVARRSDDLQILLLAINRNRFAWLVCREISSTGFLCRQAKKFWGPLIQSGLLQFFLIESGPYKIQVCKCGPQH